MIDRNFVESLKQHFANGKMRDLMEAYGFQFNAQKKTHCFGHDDKTPSMSVHPDYPICHCFVCDTTADPIEFVWRNSDAKNFPQAVEILAKFVGVEMPKDNNWKAQSRPEDKYKVFAKSIMAAAKKTPEARAIMQGGQRISAAGIGYLPEVIKQTNWVNFLKQQPKEFLEQAGIEKDGEVFAGGARYIWELTRNYEPVGFVRFGKNPKDPAQVKTRENKPGYALGDGKNRQWNTFKFVNVTNNVYDAVKIHNKADAWGPGLFYPYEQFANNAVMPDELVKHLFRNTGLRYVSYDKTDIMRFITHVLPIVEDEHLVKFVNPDADEAITRDKMKYAVTMSSFIRRFLQAHPEKQEQFTQRIVDVARQNERCTFYRDMLIMNLQDLANEKTAPPSENTLPEDSAFVVDEFEGDIPSAADLEEAQEAFVEESPPRRAQNGDDGNGR